MNSKKIFTKIPLPPRTINGKINKNLFTIINGQTNRYDLYQKKSNDKYDFWKEIQNIEFTLKHSNKKYNLGVYGYQCDRDLKNIMLIRRWLNIDKYDKINCMILLEKIYNISDNNNYINQLSSSEWKPTIVEIDNMDKINYIEQYINNDFLEIILK